MIVRWPLQCLMTSKRKRDTHVVAAHFFNAGQHVEFVYVDLVCGRLLRMIVCVRRSRCVCVCVCVCVFDCKILFGLNATIKQNLL